MAEPQKWRKKQVCAKINKFLWAFSKTLRVLSGFRAWLRHGADQKLFEKEQ